jgi:dephospho-CoA kinase
MRIAFSGKICSGKSTAANIVQDILGCEASVAKLSVASRVKELAIDLFGMEQKDRKLLQVLGQKMKEIDPDVWTRALIKQINNCGDKHIVIDDLRFPNELSALRENGFIIIRLEIQPELQLERIKETYPDTWESHVSRLDNISETALDTAEPYNYKFDHVIHINRETDIETVRKHLIEALANITKAQLI